MRKRPQGFNIIYIIINFNESKGTSVIKTSNFSRISKTF